MAAMFKAQTDIWEETQEKMSQLVGCHYPRMLPFLTDSTHEPLRLERSPFLTIRNWRVEWVRRMGIVNLIINRIDRYLQATFVTAVDPKVLLCNTQYE